MVYKICEDICREDLEQGYRGSGMRVKWMIPIFVSLLLLLFCSCSGGYQDSLLRSKVDGRNKNAFVERYKHPDWVIDQSVSTLQFISDSLPSYYDGMLRAWNNMAFAYFLVGSYDSALVCVNRVLQFEERSVNKDVEHVIALLNKARVLQRTSNIAESYRILYDVARNRTLERNKGNLLYNYAIVEYYITILELNYHYRDDHSSDVMESIEEVEERRKSLKCDYAQDMALNGALAKAYLTLALSNDSMCLSAMRQALGYCYENLSILSDSSRFCPFQYGQILETLGVAFSKGERAVALLDSAGGVVGDICAMLIDTVAIPNMTYIDVADEMLRAARYQFGQQQWASYNYIKSLIVGAEYSLSVGDTANVFVLLDNALCVDAAYPMPPHIRLRLFNEMISSGYSRDWHDMVAWHTNVELLNEEVRRIKHDDFVVQMELAESQDKLRLYVWLIISFSALVVLLVVLLFILNKRTRLLNEETVALQDAKRKDVERIANVETCLSVIRHDIGPFVGYLQNPNLPADLRNDVLGQLLRTFDNIKKWTNLSIPNGMAFHASNFCIYDMFLEAASQVVYTDNRQIDLVLKDSGLKVFADRQLLVILLRNILNNAYQHTEKGSITVEASLCEDNSDMVEVSVADTGSGMSPVVCDELFRIDKQINEGNELGYGSGFGLILAKYIIKKHDDHTVRGCKIWAKSELGKGSVFFFRIAKGS